MSDFGLILWLPLNLYLSETSSFVPIRLVQNENGWRGRRLDCRFSQSSMKKPLNLYVSETYWDVLTLETSCTKRKRKTYFDHHSPSFSCSTKLPREPTIYIYGEALAPSHNQIQLPSHHPTNWRDCISSIERGKKGNGWQQQPKSCFWKRKVSFFFRLLIFTHYNFSSTVIYSCSSLINKTSLPLSIKLCLPHGLNRGNTINYTKLLKVNYIEYLLVKNPTFTDLMQLRKI